LVLDADNPARLAMFYAGVVQVPCDPARAVPIVDEVIRPRSIAE
jgi:hypothetical protein